MTFKMPWIARFNSLTDDHSAKNRRNIECLLLNLLHAMESNTLCEEIEASFTYQKFSKFISYELFRYILWFSYPELLGVHTVNEGN